MPVLTIGAEELAALAIYLRSAEFPAGSRQLICAERLLFEMADHGTTVPREELGRWLTPIFATNETEQERFSKLYAQWESASRRKEPIAPSALLPRHIWRYRWAGAALLVMAIALVSVLFRGRPVRTAASDATGAGRPRTESKFVTFRGALYGENHEPVRGATLLHEGGNIDGTNGNGFFLISGNPDYPVLISHHDYYAVLIPLGHLMGQSPIMHHKPAASSLPPPPRILYNGPHDLAVSRSNRILRLVLALLPSTTFLLWTAYVFWKRLRLRKWRTASELEFAALSVTAPRVRIFAESEIQRAIQEMCRPKPIDVSDLWPERTVAATVENAGWFTPVYRPRKAAPEYVMLIDRSARRDQQERLATHLVHELNQGRTHIYPFYFHRDPRTSFEPEGVRAITLSELTARFGDCQLLVFAESAIFFNRFTGRPESWLATLEQWSSRVLLTPAPPAEWGLRERRLMDRGYEIRPANPGGLARLVEVLTEGTDRPYPTTLAADSKPSIDPIAPRASDQGRLLSELRLYLGPDGFRWLSACAVYPVIEWELMQHIGGRLLPPAAFGDLLRKLVRLPWSRLGSMPDWLRIALIRRMEPTLRQTVYKLLLNEAPDTAAKPSADGPKLARECRGKGAQHPTDDEVFLSFLWGRDPKGLALPAPGRLRRLFFRRGRAWLGLRPWASFATSLVCSVVIWFSTGTRTHTPVPVPARDPIHRVVVDIAVSQLRDPSYFLASNPKKGLDFPRWCYRVAALVLARKDQLPSDPTFTVATPQDGDVVSRVGNSSIVLSSGSQGLLAQWNGSQFIYADWSENQLVATLDPALPQGAVAATPVPLPLARGHTAKQVTATEEPPMRRVVAQASPVGPGGAVGQVLPPSPAPVPTGTASDLCSPAVSNALTPVARIQCYEQAAARGDHNAMFALGTIYEQGSSVPADIKAALAWYKKAADAGDPVAMNRIGEIYEDGVSIQKDYTQSRQWYEKAAAAANNAAMFHLGYLYQYGLGVGRDFSRALQWYEKGAAGGSAPAMSSLGYLHEEGLGVPRNYQQAQHWYLQGIAAGDSNAFTNLGYMYESGELPRDYQAALKYYARAAAQNEPRALYHIGTFNERGLAGFRTDLAQAEQYYRKAIAISPTYTQPQQALDRLNAKRSSQSFPSGASTTPQPCKQDFFSGNWSLSAIDGQKMAKANSAFGYSLRQVGCYVTGNAPDGPGLYDVRLAVTDDKAKGSVTRVESGCTVDVPYDVTITSERSFHVHIDFGSPGPACGMPVRQELDFERIK